MEEKPAISNDNPVTTPAVTPTNLDFESPKNSSIWTAIIIILVLLILAVTAFIAYQLGARKKIITPVATRPVASPSAVPASPQKRIAYTKDNSIFVINADGTGQKMIISADQFKTKTTDWSGAAAGVKADFNALSWKDSNDLSYVVCSRSCAIFTSNITNGDLTMEVDNPGPGGPNQISTLAWNHAGNKLAYLYNLNQPVGNIRLDFKSGSDTTLVKKFTPSAGGRGGSLDDNVSIFFSPDDSHVVVTNTATQPNNTDKSTIWIFESGGKEVANLVANAGWPTQARWADNNRIFYKMGDSVYTYYLDGAPTQKIMSQKSLENPIPFGQQIYYWLNTDALPKLGGVNIEGYYHPEVLDSNHLVALKAKLLQNGALLPFGTAGLSVVDLATNEVTDLDTGDIGLFSVSP